MEDFKVEVVKIEKIFEHHNADRLELAQVKGWVCVVGKGQFVTGDKAIYFPIDSVLPEELEDKMFANSKVKLSKHRVKTSKIRGVISQGLLFTLTLGFDGKVGDDVTKRLEVIKFEPPVRFSTKSGVQTPKRKCHPDFDKYTKISNFKNFPNIFKKG